MDAIHFHARNEGRIKPLRLGSIWKDVRMSSECMLVKKQVLALILNGLKNRGVEDILIACVD